MAHARITRRALGAGAACRLVASGLVAGALAACGRAAGPQPVKVTGPTSIVYMYFGSSPAQVQVNDEVFRTFRQAETNIKIEPLYVTTYSEYYEKVQVVSVSGDELDAIMASPPYLGQLIIRGLYRELDDLMKRDRFPAKDYIPASLEVGHWRGMSHALPDLVNFSILFYNRNALDQAGQRYPDGSWTWEQLVEPGRKVTIREGDRTRQWGVWPAHALQHLLGAIWSNGGRIFDNEDEPKRSTWNQGKVVEVLEYFGDLINKHRVAPRPSEAAELGDVFVFGQAGLNLGQTWQIANRAIQAKQFTWDVALPPKGKAGRWIAADTQSEGIHKKSKQPEAAWRFLLHRTGPPGARIVTEAQYGVPAIWDVARTTFVNLPPPPAGRRVLLDGLKEGRPYPKHAHASRLQLQVWPVELNELFNGKRSPAETAQAIDQKTNAILSEPY